MVFLKGIAGNLTGEYVSTFANYDSGEIFNQAETSKLIQAVEQIQKEGAFLCPFSNKIDRYYLFHEGTICITSISMQEIRKAISITVSHDNLRKIYDLCERLGFVIKEK